MIYHAPGYKVFVDDRCEVFGGKWLKDFHEIEYGTDSPGPVLEKWDAEYQKFDFALTRTGTPIGDDWFKASPVWQVGESDSNRELLQAEVSQTVTSQT